MRPTLAWRWKIEGVVPGGRIDRKKGDDYAARLYVTFDYDPADLSMLDRWSYHALTAMGYDVPLRALCYVWTNRAGETEMAPNPFTEWVHMIPVESGPARAGTWTAHERDLLADYRAAFGEEPPAITGFVLMTDTDNTAARRARISATSSFGRQHDEVGRVARPSTPGPCSSSDR